MFKMNKKGFTLVELLVVLAILGLLAGIGIPQYMKTLERSREAADKAVVVMVQSAVDGYLAETGVEVKPTTVGADDLGTGTGVPYTLNEDAKANSLLTNRSVNFKDFLEKGSLPEKTDFKSAGFRDVAKSAWHITANGKVYVIGTIKYDGTNYVTIPFPAP